MEQGESTQQIATQAPVQTPAPGATPSPGTGGNGGTGGAPCPTCGTSAGAAPPSYVYALGRIEARFPRLSVEKEFAQATGRADTVNLTDREALRKVLEDNRYLVKQLCWLLTVGGLETYVLYPRDPTDFNLLVEALRPKPRPGDIDLVIGTRGPIATPEVCNGLLLPIVAFDQLYSFDRDTLIKSIPRPEKKQEAERFGAAAEELFDRIMQMTDNAGATDEDRALNYLAVRYPVIYSTAADAHARNCSLTAIDVRPSTLVGVRKMVDVIFSFTNRSTDVVEKYMVRVDVTEQFPFLVTKMSPYFDR